MLRKEMNNAVQILTKAVILAAPMNLRRIIHTGPLFRTPLNQQTANPNDRKNQTFDQ
jgi:hypothetical protein